MIIWENNLSFVTVGGNSYELEVYYSHEWNTWNWVVRTGDYVHECGEVDSKNDGKLQAEDFIMGRRSL